MRHDIPRAPLLHPYQFVRHKEPKGLDKIAKGIWWRIDLMLARRHLFALRLTVRRAGKLEARFSGLDDAALDALAPDIGGRLRRYGLKHHGLLGETLAYLREITRRTLGRRAYDVQLLGAATLLSGHIAEMATGEGKTMTAAMAAALNAMAGRPVHVVTVNDYLAERDAELGRPLFERLGFTLGIIVGGQDLQERQAIYAADIVYCTNKEVAFDALRDRLVLGDRDGDARLRLDALRVGGSVGEELRLRGLNAAIVDEADSVLVDEARTPLIISRTVPSPFDGAAGREALELASSMRRGVDFELHGTERRISLTEAGRDIVAGFAEGRGNEWRGVIRREELVRQALTALFLFERDKHYMLRDDKVVIVDEHTGRAMPDRSWSDGLHQLIELKEGLEPSKARQTLARMTYQRLFRRYSFVGGLTGTARQVAGELRQVYGLAVVPIPTHRKVQRRHAPTRVLGNRERHWRAVIDRVAELHRHGAPVLIGTRTVASSLELGRRLAEAGLPHAVLNARQDGEEADIVARAGNRGAITVATNMAGRGTDIQLGAGVESLGGLHVIMVERQEARRIDRQLAGRAGRQGQPGGFEPILGLDDGILVEAGGVLWRAVARFGVITGQGWLAALAIDQAQLRLERSHASMRRQLLQTDVQQAKSLAFAGRQE
jgi:preprotein translocase subunit SecA